MCIRDSHCDFGMVVRCFVFASCVYHEGWKFGCVEGACNEFDVDHAWNDESVEAAFDHAIGILAGVLNIPSRWPLASPWEPSPMGGATEHNRPREDKPVEELVSSLELIMRRRRFVQTHDWQPITESRVLEGLMGS